MQFIPAQNETGIAFNRVTKTIQVVQTMMCLLILTLTQATAP